MMEIDILAVLSRRGWDRSGPQTAKLWTFRHAMTGDEVALPPGEVVFWAAQVDPSLLEQPVTGGWSHLYRWGMHLVRHSDNRREIGVTHSQRGDVLIFVTRQDAERAAALLNLRDSVPQQTRMEL